MKYPKDFQIYLDYGLVKEGDELMWYMSEVVSKVPQKKSRKIGRKTALVVKREGKVMFLTEGGKLFASIEAMIIASVKRRVSPRFAPVRYLYKFIPESIVYRRIIASYAEMVLKHLCSFLKIEEGSIESSFLHFWIGEDLKEYRNRLPDLERELTRKFPPTGILAFTLHGQNQNDIMIYALNKSC